MILRRKGARFPALSGAMRLSRAPLVAATLLLAASLASATTLSPGDIFQIDFSVNPSECPFGSCDTLLFSPNYTASPGALPRAILYNGDTRLGTDIVGIDCCVTGFESSSSAFDSLSTIAAVADFTSIQDGTIRGVFDFFVTGGSLLGFDPARSLFTIGHATAPEAVSSNSEDFTIDSETIITATPEPISISLVPGTIFLCILGGVRCRRAKAL
jgi:hypothetical protein